MSKEKFLTVWVAFLLLLNIGIVAFLFFSRPQRPHELWKLVIDKVEFDEQQKQQYLAQRDEHRAGMNKLDDEFARVLNLYLNMLKENPNTETENSLADLLASIEKQKAKHTLLHFRKVRALCRKEQIEKFDAVIPELMKILLPVRDVRGRGKMPPEKLVR